VLGLAETLNERGLGLDAPGPGAGQCSAGAVRRLMAGPPACDKAGRPATSVKTSSSQLASAIVDAHERPANGFTSGHSHVLGPVTCAVATGRAYIALDKSADASAHHDR